MTYIDMSIYSLKHSTMKTNQERILLIAKHNKRAKELYFQKHPNNGKTVKTYWEKCRLLAAKEFGLIS